MIGGNKKLKGFKSGLIGFVTAAFFLCLNSGNAGAQVFAPQGNKPATANPNQLFAPAPSKPAAPTRPAAPGNISPTSQQIPPAVNQNAFKTRPTMNAADSAKEKEEKPRILLYMRDFGISRNIHGDVQCSMRFFVHSTSKKEKLTSISYQLKWPEIETVLSFDDVSPDTPTYFNYVLLGKGCYSMDKTPNIVVNRCRMKGMSQKQCADIISWVK